MLRSAMSYLAAADATAMAAETQAQCLLAALVYLLDFRSFDCGDLTQSHGFAGRCA
jgi:hypothetical protein